MLLITEVKGCHDGNVEELSHKLEALTQEIQTLKQKSSNAEGANTSVDHSADIERIDQSLNSLREQYERLEASLGRFGAKQLFNARCMELMAGVFAVRFDNETRPDFNPFDFISVMFLGLLDVNSKDDLMGITQSDVRYTVASESIARMEDKLLLMYSTPHNATAPVNYLRSYLHPHLSLQEVVTLMPNDWSHEAQTRLQGLLDALWAYMQEDAFEATQVVMLSHPVFVTESYAAI